MLVRNGFSKIAIQMYKNSVDVESLKHLLTTEYTEKELVDYLDNSDPLVSRAATTALGLIGGMNVVPELVEKLKSKDKRATLITEEALWNIWSHSGDESVDEMFQAGKKHLENENYFEAIEQFTEVIESSPNFAEGYNQRAIVFFVLEKWENALEDCQKTVKLNPHHFGAYAGMGHVYLRLGKIGEAVDAYKQALTINPNLISIANTLVRLRRVLAEAET